MIDPGGRDRPLSAIGGDVAQHGIARADGLEHIRRAVTIPAPGAVHLGPDRQSARIGEDMALFGGALERCMDGARVAMAARPPSRSFT